jgi:MYXO-CTERM domain-containing protein
VVSAATAYAQPVTNGSDDADDPAVVALVTSTGAVTCTASVIGPHTLLTAAHCVATRDATTIDASLVDTNIRAVGFGLTGQNAGDEGTKRAGTARIASVAEEELIAVPDPSLPCPGDSGGPALLADGTIVGVVSRVDSMCNDHAVYTRVDVARAVLIDPYVADTAPGTAKEGEVCFYLEQCASGLECYAGTCESPAGCGCASSSSPWSLLALLGVAGAYLRRRTR